MLGVLPAIATDVVVAVSIGSIVINPLVSRLIAPAERVLLRLRRGTDGAKLDETTSSSLDPQTRAIVIGYGPTGRTVTRLLRENGISPTVVELNMDTVRALRQEGISAVYGDARHSDSLVTAGLRHAGTLIVSGADTGAAEIVNGAREINPRVHTFVRSVYLRDVPPLKAAGAEQVFSGEGEVALAMTEAVLRRLGATAEQVDRERDRVRAELFGKPVQ
jgi:CPA2 family monovalent cation:H+ antiporter-2